MPPRAVSPHEATLPYLSIAVKAARVPTMSCQPLPVGFVVPKAEVPPAPEKPQVEIEPAALRAAKAPYIVPREI